MNYSELIEKAKESGINGEKVMYQSIDALEDMLCVMKKEHPDKYWDFMRKQHGIIFKDHYSEDFAKYDAQWLHYKDEKGIERTGAHWSIEEIEKATAGMVFPAGTTKWDKYVAFNSMYADLCKKFDEATIIKVAHTFYFADDDAPDGKIWRYMQAMR